MFSKSSKRPEWILIYVSELRTQSMLVHLFSGKNAEKENIKVDFISIWSPISNLEKWLWGKIIYIRVFGVIFTINKYLYKYLSKKQTHLRLI